MGVPIDARLNKKTIDAGQMRIDPRADKVLAKVLSGFASGRFNPPYSQLAEDDSFQLQNRKIHIAAASFSVQTELEWMRETPNNMAQDAAVKVRLTQSETKPVFCIYFRERAVGASFDEASFETQLLAAVTMLIRGFIWHPKEGEELPDKPAYSARPSSTFFKKKK